MKKEAVTGEFIVNVGESVYDGDFHTETNATKVTLNHSKLDKGWTEKVSGKEAVAILDDGNGIIVRFKDKALIGLDYSQVCELRAILNVYGDMDEIRDVKPTTFKKRYVTKKFSKKPIGE